MTARSTRAFLSGSPRETFVLARRLGEILPDAALVALYGDLGAGKTLFTKGLASGLGVRETRRVNSPTFVIQQEYVGRVRVRHIDAYRLEGVDELQSLGFDELVAERDGVIVVEWADRVREAIPAGAFHVHLESETVLPAGRTEGAPPLPTFPLAALLASRPVERAAESAGVEDADPAPRQIEIEGDAEVLAQLV